MTGKERKCIIETLERHGRDRQQKLRELGIPSSTYYYWKQVYLEDGPMALDKRKAAGRRIWNRLMEDEESMVLKVAMQHPELSSRLLAIRITDNSDFYVSESKVYALLKQRGKRRA